jgi:GlpG protein
MRLIGHLHGEGSASAFSDFLYAQGIKNEAEQDQDDRWALWVHEEEEVERAKGLLSDFLGHPGDAKFQGFSSAARELKQRERREEEAARKKIFDRRKLFPQLAGYSVGPLTWLLILVSAAVFLVELLNPEFGLRKLLQISAVRRREAFPPEVLTGEFWRLITPIFLHGSPAIPGLLGMSILHIVMNMLWMRDLGSMIEARQSTARLALLVLVSAVCSNLGQYYASGPDFVGMSGVVYALLGYIWMRGKFDPASGLYLHPQTVTMMVLWFFLCYTGWVGRIANTAHAVGLIVGIAWGLLSAKLSKP